MKQPVSLPVAVGFVLFAVLAAARTAIAAAPDAAAYAPPPLALYGQLPTMEDPALSPDGNQIAYVERQGDERYLVVADPEAGKIIHAIRLSDTKVRNLLWFDDSRLLILYSATSYPPEGLYGPRDEWYMLVTWDLVKNRMQPASLHDDDVGRRRPKCGFRLGGRRPGTGCGLIRLQRQRIRPGGLGAATASRQ